MSAATTIPFHTIGGDLIEADTIAPSRVPLVDPNEVGAFQVTYTANGSPEQHIVWVSYYVYCMLRDVEKQLTEEVNTLADMLG